MADFCKNRKNAEEVIPESIPEAPLDKPPAQVMPHIR